MNIHLLDKSAARKDERLAKGVSASGGLRIRTNVRAGINYFGGFPSPRSPMYKA